MSGNVREGYGYVTEEPERSGRVSIAHPKLVPER